MDQSKSSSASAAQPPIAIPPRKFTLEFWVGLFAMVSLVMFGWLAVGLGGLALFGSGRYQIFAEFDNISGLQKGASVEIGGVPIGEVSDISLKDPKAIVALAIDEGIKIRDDDVLRIRTKGIIGDRYVSVSRGASTMFIEPGNITTETESVVDIEDLIGKIVHSMTGEKDEKKEDK